MIEILGTVHLPCISWKYHTTPKISSCRWQLLQLYRQSIKKVFWYYKYDRTLGCTISPKNYHMPSWNFCKPCLLYYLYKVLEKTFYCNETITTGCDINPIWGSCTVYIKLYFCLSHYIEESRNMHRYILVGLCFYPDDLSTGLDAVPNQHAI